MRAERTSAVMALLVGMLLGLASSQGPRRHFPLDDADRLRAVRERTKGVT